MEQIKKPEGYIKILSEKLQNEVDSILQNISEVVYEYDENDLNKIHFDVDEVLNQNTKLSSKIAHKTNSHQQNKIMSSHIKYPHFYNSDSYKGTLRNKHSNILMRMLRVTKTVFN